MRALHLHARTSTLARRPRRAARLPRGAIVQRASKSKSPTRAYSSRSFINLTERPDRRASVEEQARAASLRVTRLEAEKGDETDLVGDHRVAQGLHPKLNQFLATKKLKRFRGVLGCNFLHRAAVRNYMAKDIFMSKTSLCIVLEDDVVIAPDFVERICETARRAPKGWEVLRIDCWGARRDEDHISSSLDNYRIYKAVPPTWEEGQGVFYGGSHCVVYRSETMAKVDEHFNRIHVASPDEILTTRRLKSYVVDCGACGVDERWGSDIPRDEVEAEPEDEE